MTPPDDDALEEFYVNSSVWSEYKNALMKDMRGIARPNSIQLLWSGYALSFILPSPLLSLSSPLSLLSSLSLSLSLSYSFSHTLSYSFSHTLTYPLSHSLSDQNNVKRNTSSAVLNKDMNLRIKQEERFAIEKSQFLKNKNALLSGGDTKSKKNKPALLRKVLLLLLIQHNISRFSPLLP